MKRYVCAIFILLMCVVACSNCESEEDPYRDTYCEHEGRFFEAGVYTIPPCGRLVCANNGLSKIYLCPGTFYYCPNSPVATISNVRVGREYPDCCPIVTCAT